MEVTPHTQPLRRVNYLILSLCLAVMAVSMAAVTWVLAGAYVRAETDQARGTFGTWIALAAGLLGLAVLLLAWVLLRWVRLRLHVGQDHCKPTGEHPDAWIEAGRRVETPPDED